MRSDPLEFLSRELDDLRAQGLYRTLRVLDGEQKAHTSVDHHDVVNLSSNNYLGLTTHPRLRERALEITQRLGVGSGSVRTIAGTMEIHLELERKLAAFKRTEACVVFQSGFTANAGTVSSILDKEGVIISDELNHASIIDGARLSRATIKVFPHRDAGAARKIVAELPPAQKKLIITDGVFSMDGDLGALPALCDVADEYGCVMMVDDAHASGVFGKNGRGTVDHFGMHGRVDVQVGTLSKAVGVLGGMSQDRVRSSSFSITAPVRSSFQPRILLRWPPPASPPSRFSKANPNSSIGCGTTRVSSSRPAGARLQYGGQRKPDHPGDRRRRAARHAVVGSSVRHGRLRPGHRISNRSPRQGACPYDRDGAAHPRGAAVRPRLFSYGRQGPRRDMKG
jgi:hypothetical protein